MRTFTDRTQLRGHVLRNRVFRSATWLGMAGSDGMVTDEIRARYREYARGQVGVIVSGFTKVCPFDGDLAGGVHLTGKEHVPGHRQLTDAVHEYGSCILVQAAMLDTCTISGRQKSVNIFTAQDFQNVADAYAHAAGLAEEAGYDGLQIHAAHFFGLSKMISPLWNTEMNVHERAQILVDIYRSIRDSVAPTFLITVKINSSDFSDGGLDVEEFCIISGKLAEAGIDAIEVSGNGTSVPHIRPHENEAYFLSAALRLRSLVQTPVILVGGLRSPETVQDVLDAGIDYVSLSRPLLCEPDLVARWIEGDLRPSRCVSCNACYKTPDHQCIQRIREQA